MPSQPTPEGSHSEDSAAPSSLLGRRVLALAIDWAVASAISAGLFDFDPMVTLAIFAGMTFVLVTTLGFTIGHRVGGVRIERLVDGASPPTPLQALVRTIALCLVLPAVIWGPDSRGMHDVWAGTRVGLRAQSGSRG